MPTITITTSKTYTAEEYYYEHIAPDESQFAVDDIWNALERFLEAIGTELDHRSEWSWCAPHRGLRATPYNSMINRTQIDLDESWCEIYCEVDFLNLWQKSQPKLEMLSRQFRRMRSKSDRWWDRFSPERSDHYERRAEALESAYLPLLEETLKAICYRAELLMRGACDYYYSDEACAEWVRINEDLFDEED